jgi:anthranilate synthase component 2
MQTVTNPIRVVIIDNYDSFTYNLAHLVESLGAEVTVWRNDQFEIPQLERFDKILLSPGPGIPSEAGLLCEVIRAYAGRKPILGICLGHQAVGEVFGARLENLSEVYHGVATEGSQWGNDPIFSSRPQRVVMGRYHSWVVSRDNLPHCLTVTAESDDGCIMALKHNTYDVRGLQFHPESVLTPDGAVMLRNWLYPPRI